MELWLLHPVFLNWTMEKREKTGRNKEKHKLT
jgi:hypothetical protein